MDWNEREALRRDLESRLGVPVSARRVKAIRTNSLYHWQPPLKIEVGSYCPHLEKDAAPMLVEAIFESKSFLVCTPDHGPNGTLPIFFLRADIKQVIDFRDTDNVSD